MPDKWRALTVSCVLDKLGVDARRGLSGMSPRAVCSSLEQTNRRGCGTYPL